jgi:pSer/pThr/pTyr-binding forkhead associated (FHA) protein
MYRLVFLSGRYEGKRLVVRQAVTLVGRDADCHLFLPDDELLASRHARFEERGTGVFLSSLSPAHPVERNGQPVREIVRLAHNDLLTLGQTRVQFQDIIAPHQRFRPSAGLLQPMTWLVVAAILAIEAGLLVFLVDWPRRIIRPETEASDRARAETLRADRAAENAAETSTVSTAGTPASVITLPGTKPSAPAPATNANGTQPTSRAPDSIPAAPAIIEVLDEADFVPADTNIAIIDLPPISAADPLIEEAQRMLSEAVTAAQFADYAKATRLLNQIHQNAPGFLPAHIEHARLLEARGDLDAAQQRWSQIMGIAPESSPFRAQATEERQRLAGIQSLQTQILQSAETPDLSVLPRYIRILATDLQKMPADADISEMRVLNATVELAPDAPLFKDASIRIFITFYDIDSDNRIQPTQAITTSSPLVLGKAFADRRSLPLSATYVVPRGFRDREARETGHSNSYYGYTLHVFAGLILQDAIAKPKKLLDLPIHFPAATDSEP